MAHYPKMRPEEDNDGWTRWLAPHERKFKMACCDCGLVHDMEFRLETVIDAEGAVQLQVQFRVRRNGRATGQIRRWQNIKVRCIEEESV